MKILSKFEAEINNTKVHTQEYYVAVEELVEHVELFKLPKNEALYLELYQFISSFIWDVDYGNTDKLITDTYDYSRECGYLQFSLEGYDETDEILSINERLKGIINGEYTQIILTNEKNEMGLFHNEDYYTIWSEEEPYYICVGEEVINVTDLLNISDSEFKMIIQNLQEPIMFNVHRSYFDEEI